MRRLFPAFLALTLAALGGGRASAQITLVPGPDFLVSVRPTFVAAADFNRDGRADLVTTNTSSAKATVLFGGRDGAFSPVVDLPLGRRPRGVAAGDLNSDRNPDIAAVTTRNSQVLVATGNGDGTFNRPATYRVGSGPADLAIGNFDGQRGNDIVTADKGSNKVSVLLNRGGNLGFTPLGDIAVGGRSPKRVAAGDLNGDGFDDIVTVNVGASGADNVSVLLNTGVGSFGAPVNFTVGRGAVDVAITDVSNDGVPDLAVLNARASSTPNIFSISILLNRTEIVGGRPVGTGFFDVKAPVTLTCPATIGGLLIDCHPNFLAAGDLDGDGFIDLAVSFFTRPHASGGLTPGFIQAFAGHGDGTFEFATQVGVGHNPQGLAPGDFTGNGSVDLGLAERGDSSLRIIRSLAPPPKGLTEGCNLTSQCVPGLVCVDHVCCGNASCPAGQFCNIPGHKGQCSAPVPNGNPCDIAAQCQSKFCVDNFCCGSPSCPAGQFCNTGQCADPASDGTPCSHDEGAQCSSSFCVDGVCCALPTCPAEQVCNIPGLEGLCTPAADPGTPCTDDGQCLSGHCTDQVCCESATCGAGEICNVPGREGQCTVRPTRTPTPTPTPIPAGHTCTVGTQCASGFCVDHVCCGSASCPAGQFCNTGQCAAPSSNGTPCTNGTQCQSNFCVDGICCGSASCPAGQFCNTGHCAGPSGAGTPCTNGAQCSSSFCTDGVCCSTATCPAGQFCSIPGVEGQCAPPASLGSPCTDGGQCQSGHCTDQVCCTSSTCAAGQACNVLGQAGQCAVRPTRTPTPTQTPTPQPNGAPCAADPQCVSGFCADGYCCGSRSCPAGQFCSIFGSRGTCAQKKVNGGTCDTNFDCLSGYCQAGAPSVCAVPPTPTATATPTPKGPGDPCTSPVQCRADLFCTNGVCCGVAACPVGQGCGDTGTCVRLPTPTPTKMPEGIACDPSTPDACASGFCTDSVCCDTDTCFSPDRCDILGAKGTCSAQLGVGEPCEKNADCEDGLLCLPDLLTGELFCSVPPTATPTFFPTFTPTPVLKPIITVSQSGGCSIGGGADGSGVWMLGVLPLVLWVLRFRLQRARIRAHVRVRRE